ncbi:hypothetical protein K9N50_12840 [bacterium]|nr:hypothetical protein [bacterium]
MINSAVPSSLETTKSRCELMASTEITKAYKLPGHIRCTSDKTWLNDHQNPSSDKILCRHDTKRQYLKGLNT